MNAIAFTHGRPNAAVSKDDEALILRGSRRSHLQQ
jgi:hypothetical protein